MVSYSIDVEISDRLVYLRLTPIINYKGETLVEVTGYMSLICEMGRNEIGRWTFLTVVPDPLLKVENRLSIFLEEKYPSPLTE